MSISQRDERRALNVDEQETVAHSHHPHVQTLDEAALGDLTKRLRDLRDKARTEAHRRRREMRGKARPKGAEASKRDEGSALKLDVLAQALKRVNAERARRQRANGREATVEAARRALALRQSSAGGRGRPVDAGRTSRKGMRANPNTKAPQIGSAMEAGRVSQFVKNAQAARDSR
ncbi:MAG: hypothetical protein EA356_02565 [Geminicoccaceae bacterium]|nr:MAG: hypothetical protein EA356_02565 [Geminicoccaceae bacterium]